MDVVPQDRPLIGGRFKSEDERNAWLASDEFSEFTLAAFVQGVEEAVAVQKRRGIICKT